MRAVVQRVKSAEVRVSGTVCGAISTGLLLYVGVEAGDSEEDIEYIAGKVIGLRIFGDEEGRMNLDIKDAQGELLVISQFTLSGDVRKGRRPSFAAAEQPEKARELYEELVEKIRVQGLNVATGEFRAHMEVESINDGPVTLLLDSRRLF